MKNQYVGDVNDFVKYGLLRTLTAAGERSSLVAWLLTPDDSSTDGRKLAYLGSADTWRHRDAALFDGLQRLVAEGGRSVTEVECKGLLPRAQFCSELVPTDAAQRQRYFAALLRVAREQELVFFDPDNGMEIPSCPPGRQGSDKYLLWRELTETYRAGHSILVYQHFRREARNAFVDRTARLMAAHTAAREVLAFQTSHVAFFLIPQHHESGYFKERAEESRPNGTELSHRSSSQSPNER